jgi:hypothetical protein
MAGAVVKGGQATFGGGKKKDKRKKTKETSLV